MALFLGRLAICAILVVDGQPASWQVARAGGQLDAVLLSAILTRYSVQRGFPSLAKDKKRLEEVAGLLNERLARVPKGLWERYQDCQGIASDLKTEGFTPNGVQISAVTKLSWFMQPEGWTVFDSLARKGLGVSDAPNFYKKLSNHRYWKRVSWMNSVLNQSDWKGLQAERVVDAILLNKASADGSGGMISEELATELFGMVNGLPRSAGISLLSIATTIQLADGKPLTPTCAFKVIAEFADQILGRSPAGEWITHRDQLPFVRNEPWADEFVQKLYDAGVIAHDFDWGEWLGTTDGVALSEDPVAVATANPDDLTRLIIAIIRGDRFNEGLLLRKFEDGTFQAIAQRAVDCILLADVG